MRGAAKALNLLLGLALGGLFIWYVFHDLDMHRMMRAFEEADYTDLIPVDKKLDPAWKASLFARGEPAVYEGEEALRYIGMPVGGITCGQVYLGGDGKLWLFDIFNKVAKGVLGKGSRGETYVHPLEQTAPLEQGFFLRWRAGDRGGACALDRRGPWEIRFRGAYPVGRVWYRSGDVPLSLELEAFSPFCPLDTEDSSLPLTVMRFTVKNEGKEPVEAEVAGLLENAVCLDHDRPGLGVRRNRVKRGEGFTALFCSAVPPPPEKTAPRPEILFEDFEHEGYGPWEVTGTAFGRGPVRANEMPDYQGDAGAEGERLVNSHNARHGEDVRAADAHTGTLTSPPFTIRRKYITFLLGGGRHPGETCVELLVDGKTVRTATGRNANRMEPCTFDVHDLEGKTARIRIKDTASGGWGNIGVDDIRFSDTPREAPMHLEELPDHGTLCLAVLGGEEETRGCAAMEGAPRAEPLFAALAAKNEGCALEAERAFGEARPAGAVSRTLRLGPGEEGTVTFLLAWHFPNTGLAKIRGPTRRYYTRRFSSALDAAAYGTAHLDRLRERTLRWHDTWYGSTLPGWFLDRTFANASTLAASTVYRFEDGRFYGWEGVGCCPGTCTHVWHYAQAPAHLFPDLERDLRERVDFGLAFHEDTGLIDYRGEFSPGQAAFDGQAGVILRAFREHRMGPDDRFLKRNWPRIRKATAFLMARDRDGDGILDGAQPNTLDAAWYGKIAWISSLYHAALRAAEEMARETGDTAFAERARAAYEKGRRTLEEELFNGEYFIQVPDPEHRDAIGADTGCYIDQVIGQWWAHQVGLGRLFDAEKQKSALRSLWKYDFAPDVGPFRKRFKQGRWYAVEGDAGLIMCTWPRGGLRAEYRKHWQYGYFNECMTGFEWQAASHMIWEGLVLEGLAVARAIYAYEFNVLCKAC